MKNYGLVIDQIKIGEDYILGGYGSLGGEPLQPTGQWVDWLPENEEQLNKAGFDPLYCASEGTENALGMLARRLYGQHRNWSARYIAKVSETTKQGNSPQKTAEAIRKLGVPNEVDWPYTDEIATWEEFYKDIPRGVAQLALAFLAEFNFKHEYVVTQPYYLKQALTLSPLGVSVTAWFKNDKGLYYFPSGMQNNHWCVMVGYKEGEYWLIYDSYNPGELKRVEWGASFQIAKRYSLNRQVASQSLWERFITWLTLAAHGVTNVDEEVPPQIPPKTLSERITEVAKAKLGTDASPRNRAPQELSCAEGVVSIVNEALPGTLNPDIVGTDQLYKALSNSGRFELVKDPTLGCIVVSPRTSTKNGHTGIYVAEDSIASNDSRTGTLEVNYTRESWRAAFIRKRGLKGFLFKPVGNVA